MSYFDLYRRRVNSKGKTVYERILNEQRENFYDYLARTPEREYIKIVDPSGELLEGKPSPTYLVAILEKTENEKKKFFQVLAPLEVPLKQGTLVDWNNAIWLVYVEQEKHKNTHFKGILQKCNNILKWIDQYGHLCNVNCYISGNVSPDFTYQTSSNGFGSTFSFAYATVDGSVEAVLPKNNQTSLLKEQDSFLLNNKAFELTSIDDFSYEGIIGVLLKRIMKDSVKDDLVNSITQIDRLNSWKIVIGNGDTHSLISVGEERQLEIKVYKDNNIVGTPKLNYYIEDPEIISFDLETNKITALKDGNTKLRIFLDECKDFFSELSVEVGGISTLEVNYSFIGNEVIKEGCNTYLYTAKKVYNGAEDVLANFKFSVKGNARQLVTIKKIERNVCAVVTNCQSKYGKIKLIADDGLFPQEKEITVESLI